MDVRETVVPQSPPLLLKKKKISRTNHLPRKFITRPTKIPAAYYATQAPVWRANSALTQQTAANGKGKGPKSRTAGTSR